MAGPSGFGTGPGQSISAFDWLTGTNTVHGLIHGQDYSGIQAGLYDQAIGGLASPYGSAKASLMKALGAVNAGYGNAESALAQQGSVATKQLLDREQQQLAGNKQSLIDRGLYGTTTYEAINRGTAADTNTALSELNAQLASIGSNIKIGQGQAQAGVFGQLAGLDQNYMALLASLGAAKAGGVEQGDQGGMGGLLGGIIGGLSDRRLKKNIVKVGTVDNLDIYEFDYEATTGIKGRWRGVIAQEIAYHRPDAVTQGSDGFLRVDYAKLGFEMAEVV